MVINNISLKTNFEKVEMKKNTHEFYVRNMLQTKISYFFNM